MARPVKPLPPAIAELGRRAVNDTFGAIGRARVRTRRGDRESLCPWIAPRPPPGRRGAVRGAGRDGQRRRHLLVPPRRRRPPDVTVHRHPPPPPATCWCSADQADASITGSRSCTTTRGHAYPGLPAGRLSLTIRAKRGSPPSHITEGEVVGRAGSTKVISTCGRGSRGRMSWYIRPSWSSPFPSSSMSTRRTGG